MRTLLTFILALLVVSVHAQSTNRTPLNKPYLQSNGDGNGKGWTNLGTLVSTNFIDANTGLPYNSGAVGTQTPWAADIDGANHNLSGVGSISAGTISGNASGLSNIVDDLEPQQFRYLRVSSSSSGLNGYTNFYFKSSSDGVNWFTTTTNEFSNFIEDTNGATCFTPCVLWWSNKFWVAYDKFATGGPTNKFGLASSTNLIDWTNIGSITLTLNPGGNIWGSRWYLDNTGQPWLTTAIGWPGHKKCYITRPTNNSMTTWAAPTLIYNDASSGGPYDPQIVTIGTTNILYFATDTGLIGIATNTTTPQSTFVNYTNNIFPIVDTTSTYEGPSVVRLPSGTFRMYIVGDPNGISKGYYSESTNGLVWSSPKEIVESGSQSDNGSVLVLDDTAQRFARQTHRGNQAFMPHYFVEELATTPASPTAVGLKRWVPDAGVEKLEFEILGLSSDGSVASFHVTAIAGSDILGGMQIAKTNILVRSRPSATYQATVLSSLNSVAPVVTGPSSQDTRWRIETVVTPLSTYPTNGGLAFNVAYIDEDLIAYGTAKFVGNASGLTNGNPALATNNATATDGQVLSRTGNKLKWITAGSGSQTPWTSDINGGNHLLTNFMVGERLVVSSGGSFLTNEFDPGNFEWDIQNDGGYPVNFGSGGFIAANVQIGSGGPQLTAGVGSPEGVVTAGIGSLYMRNNGSAGTSLYVKESGAGNTGWTAVGSVGGGVDSTAWHIGGNNAALGNILGTTNQMRFQMQAFSNFVAVFDTNSTIRMGRSQVVETNKANDSSIWGGYNSIISGASTASTIVGGHDNVILSGGSGAAVNTAIIGGTGNTNMSNQGVIIGGNGNTIGFAAAGIVTGTANTLRDSTGSVGSSIIGGTRNDINTNANGCTIVGGQFNAISNGVGYSVIGGGYQNSIGPSAADAVVPGGFQNYANAFFTFAAGNRAKAIHNGAFVWADSQGADFSSSAQDQFDVRAQGGMYVNGGLISPTNWIEFCLSDETTAITTGTAKVSWRAPHAMTLKDCRASLSTASSSGIPTVNIKEAGTTIFSTKLTIDANETTSTTAVTAFVFSDTSIADDALITFDIDVAGTGAAGLKVKLYYTR